METMITENPNKIKNSKLLAKVDGLDKRYFHCGFRNYETNDKNKNQFEICKNLKDGESITLTGRTGTGKSHLAVAILKNYPMHQAHESEWLRSKMNLQTELSYTQSEENKIRINELLESEIYKYRKASCLFLPVVEMFMQLNEASYNSGENGKLRLLDQYTNYDCLCLDDLGAEKLTEASRQNLYAVIDRRYRAMKPVIITSNFTIKEINNVEPRIASRLAEMGKILEFNGEDYRMRSN